MPRLSTLRRTLLSQMERTIASLGASVDSVGALLTASEEMEASAENARLEGQKQGFAAGAVWAAAEMHRRGEGTFAEELLQSCGVTLEELRKPESRGGFADYDRKPLLAAIKEGQIRL